MTGIAPNTRYGQLASQLLEAIRRGRHPLGSLLPTEMELCERYGVSRITVRAAIRELAQRGLVSRRAGVGTRVEAISQRERFVHAANSVEDFLQQLAGLTLRSISAQVLQADERQAADMGCAPGTKLLRMQALRMDRGDVPVCLSVHLVPADLAAAARLMNGRSGSLATRVARAAGEPVGEIRQFIDARNLTAAEARLLHARRGEAALLSRRWYHGAGGRVLVYSHSLFAQGRYSYSMRMRREPAAP